MIVPFTEAHTNKPKQRLRHAWKVLRGQSVMYRVHFSALPRGGVSIWAMDRRGYPTDRLPAGSVSLGPGVRWEVANKDATWRLTHEGVEKIR